MLAGEALFSSVGALGELTAEPTVGVNEKRESSSPHVDSLSWRTGLSLTYPGNYSTGRRLQPRVDKHLLDFHGATSVRNETGQT